MKKDFDAERAFNKMFDYMQDMDRRMNDRFDQNDKRFDRIEQILDESAGDYKTLIAEHAAEVSSHDRFENTLENHETRIAQLEEQAA